MASVFLHFVSLFLYHIQNIKDDFIEKIYQGLDKKQKFIINLAGLFHDCGKGRGKDHHIVGQNLFKKFAKSLKENLFIMLYQGNKDSSG